MTEQNINKEAFKQAEKELMEGKISEVKGYILETLNRIEDKKKEKEKVEEELRVLKLDLEDLRNGKFEKIEERFSKSPVSQHVSVRLIPLTFNNPFIDWNESTSGTYPTKSGNIFYF